MDTAKAKMDSSYYTRKRGTCQYELKNHLGNVLVTVTDRKIPKNTDSDTLTEHYVADVASAQDYYPFGMMQPGRSYEADTSESFRFGFQGQEKENDLYGDGNAYAFKYRTHDPRTGRFWSIDPLIDSFPNQSPYVFSENRLIDHFEYEGLEALGMEVKFRKYMKARGGIQKQAAEDVEEKVVEVPMDKATSFASKQAIQEGGEQLMEIGFEAIGKSINVSPTVQTLSIILSPKGMSENQTLSGRGLDPFKQPEPTNSKNELTIEKRDTFWDIENNRDIEHGSLEEANPDVDPKNLQPGDKIDLPSNENNSGNNKDETQGN